MNPHVEGDSRTVKPFKFSDSFLAGFNALITTYDKKMEDLSRVKSLIDKDAHHGVCNCSYKMRYITPSDISTFISNLERAMDNHLFKPHTSDCDLFAVESVKRFLQANGCIPFDAPTIMGNPGADIPKGATLADLTFAAESECFNLIVYSKYELDKRVDCMREDIGKMQNMHFSAAIKSIVQKLPDIMNKKAESVLKDSLLAKAMEVYIEDFIIFAVRLNLTTVLQMLGYAIPRAAYKNEPSPVQSNESANNADDWDEDNDFFQQEAVDSNAVSPVYIVFTKGENLIGKAIRKATDSDYSHISISFDPSLDNMYSFSLTSFKKESIHDKEKANLDIDVYGVFITRDGANSMQDVCAELITNIKKTHYDYPAFFKKLVGSDKRENKSNYKQICTTFVNSLFSLVGTTLSDKKIPSPKEMREAALAKPDQVFSIYTGNSKEYNRKKAADALREKAKDPKTKRFDEVVTECCTGFIKTNDYIITNKIPFNCNMRDIVLQDMHPQFKDTLSALKFIMNDERSPVHQLVIQHYTEPIDDYDPEMVIKMFFGCPRHNHWEDPNSRDQLANEKANMNTDVNWLDKITYGNMFHDGNYRRDGLGNQHTHPIMNSFETIYKMFGGCDNICDNAGLSNSLIRISRVMKAIIERYCEGGIPNWEMCRDILSVFGEIFTRHMLRLYYNNNHHLVVKDQMPDTMIPGYMYAESFVMEANGWTSSSENNKDAGKSAVRTAVNVATKLGEWLRDKLAKFMPTYFETTISKQCDWFNNNGENKYKEIKDSAEKGTYHFPTKNKFYSYNVTFDPSKIDVKSIITEYKDKDLTVDQTKTEFKAKLMNVFPNATNKGLANELAKLSGDALAKATTNAILFSTTEEVQPKPDYQINVTDWTGIYETMKYMCQKGQDGKSHGGQWAEGFKNFANSLSDALKQVQSETNTESLQIDLGDNTILQEMEKGGTEEEKKDETNPPTTPAKKPIEEIISDVANAFWGQSANTIVSQLFKNTYNDFKAIIDDYETTKKGGTDATEQQKKESQTS